MDEKKRGLVTEEAGGVGEAVGRALEAYKRARQRREEFSERAKAVEKDFRQAETSLVDALIDSGWKSIKDDNDVLFHLHPKCFVSTRQEIAHEIETWLKSRGQEPQDFKVEKYNESRLRAYVEEVIETEGELAIPEFFGLNTVPGITAKGWNAAFAAKKKEGKT